MFKRERELGNGRSSGWWKLRTCVTTALGLLALAGAGPAWAEITLPFPARAEDLRAGEYWWYEHAHGGAEDGSEALDIVGTRFDKANSRWTRLKAGITVAEYEANKRNSDHIVYGKPVYAPADGEIVSAWRNAPENPRPGTPHEGRAATPKTIPRSGNHVAILTSGGKLILLAHLTPGTVPASLCPNGAAYVQNADNKKNGIPVETFIPAGSRPKVKRGQLVGLAGNSGASSGPHLHTHAASYTETTHGNSEPIRFRDAWVKSTRELRDETGDWKELKNQELPAPPQAILPDYGPGHREISRALIPADDYQFTVGHVANSGYRMDLVDAFEAGAGRFFNLLFRPSDGGWSARHGLNDGQLRAEIEAKKQGGMRVHQLESYPEGGSVRYAVIFRSEGPQTHVYHGVSQAEHQQQLEQLTSQGWIPRNISVQSVGGGLRYAVVLEKSGGAFEARSTLTPAEYQAKAESNRAAGRECVYLNAYRHQGETQIVAIWRSGVPSSRARHGMNVSTYQAEFDDAMEAGMLTRALAGYSTGSSPVYAAVWRK